MTTDDFVEMVCVSLNDYLEETRNRIKILVPVAIRHIMRKYQWECTTKIYPFSTIADQEYVELPEDFDKERSLRRIDYEGEIDYITPEEYNEKKAISATPYNGELVKYTIMSGTTLLKKWMYFLDPPTSAISCSMIYNIKVTSGGVEALPDEFISTLLSLVIYRMIAPMLVVGGIKMPNPSFVSARDDYRSNLTELIAYEEGQRGRKRRAQLDDVAKRAYRYYHR